MSPEQWNKVMDLFLEACEKSGGERVALLDSVSSDDASLRLVLEQMLRDHEAGGSFLNDSPLQCLAPGKISPSVAGAGKKFGRYEVVAPIGYGGMGEVWVAQDTELERPVALKFLPAHFTHDPGRIAQLRLEAKAASALNHPNIVTVHEIGQAGDTWFIAEELIEGVTLRQRLATGKLPVEEMLEIAIQCSVALETAHRAGILHRDIKPENIMLRPDGLVKMVDFGLARISEAVPNSALQTTPTGNIMGTPRYMSPEQARGDELDARTDLFSLGVVLYEIATGNAPFQGVSPATTIASVLRHSPQPPTQLNSELPPELGRSIEKALEKDRNTRYQSAADLLGDLKRIKRDIDSGRLTTRISDLPGGVPAPWYRHTVGWLLAAAAAILLAAIAGFLLARPLPPPRVLAVRQITSDQQAKSGPFLTEGSRLYFNTGPYLTPQPYEVPTSGGESIPVPIELKNAWVLDISPDRAQLLLGSFGKNPYTFYKLTLWVAPVLGGSPRRLNDLVVGDAAWSHDGQLLAFSKGSELYVARSDGTEIRKVFDASGLPFWPRWSADGSKIRFSVGPTESSHWNRDVSHIVGSRLWEVSSNGTNAHPLFPGWQDAQCCGTWTADGKYFVFEAVSKGETNVWAVREKFSVFQRTSHVSVKLTTGPMETYGPAPSLDGRRIFVGGRQLRIEILRYDLRSKAFIPFLVGNSAEGLDFSRDGKWVAYVSYPAGTLWRSTINGENRLQLSAPPMHTSLPRWSPDGKRIAFMASQPGRPPKIFAVAADGGTPQELTATDNGGYDPTWAPDGSAIAFGGYPIKLSASKLSIELLDLRTHHVSVVPGSEGLWSPRWSPNGRYIAALSSDTKTLLLFDFHSQRWTELATANFGYPTWSRDSEYIYFDTLGEDAALSRVHIRDRKVEQIVSLRNVSRKVGAFGAWSGLAPDDSPLVAHDASFDQIYALEWEAP